MRALDVPAGVYEIGGADVLTYRDLVAAYGDETGRGGIAVSVPLPAALADAGIPSAVAALAPGAGTVTATAQLVESLRFDSTVHESRDDVFGVAPRGVREAIREAVG